MRQVILLLALLSACGGPGFSAPCGVTGDNLDEFELQRETIRAVDALGTVDGWSTGSVCYALDGYTVKGHPAAEGSWFDAEFHQENVAGLTDCPERLIQIGTGTSLRASALAHEFAHAVEGCTDASLAHRGWNGDGGIYEAIAHFNGEANP